MLALDDPACIQGRWGMTLFMGRGFAAWRHAWTQAAPTRDEDPGHSTRVTEAHGAVRLTDEVQMQMVSALAGMVLDALRGEAA
jgi:hypothetical protein